MTILRLILRLLPWVLLMLTLAWIWLGSDFSFEREEGSKETYQSTILTRVEQIGKLELARYTFQEVTEVKKVADVIDLKFFKYKVAPDSKAVLISHGTATGCIDLGRLTSSDLVASGDTLFITLPAPEMCYFKIDLEKSRIYDLQVTYLPEEERRKFVEELYQAAEKEIRNAALRTDILQQTAENARLVLKPLFEDLSGKTVIIHVRMDTALRNGEK